jgi:hypothetical protein
LTRTADILQNILGVCQNLQNRVFATQDLLAIGLLLPFHALSLEAVKQVRKEMRGKNPHVMQ